MSVASVTILCIVVLLAMFTVGTAFSINMGIIGFIASFIIGNVLMGVDVNTILSGIPTDLFVIIIGVSYFFNILRDNGTIDLIFRCGLKLVRGRVWLMPWIMYALSFLLCGLGTQGTATIVIVAPIALALADRCKISQIMMSVFVAFGMFAGLYSPLNVTGISVGGVMGNAGLPFSFLSLNACMIGFTLGLGLVLYILYGGVKLFKAGKVEIDALAEAGGTDTRITAYQTASLAGLCVLVILGMVPDEYGVCGNDRRRCARIDAAQAPAPDCLQYSLACGFDGLRNCYLHRNDGDNRRDGLSGVPYYGYG